MNLLGKHGCCKPQTWNIGWVRLKVPSGNLTQLLNMAIEIVDFPMKNGDFPQLCEHLPEGKNPGIQIDGSFNIDASTELAQLALETHTETTINI